MSLPPSSESPNNPMKDLFIHELRVFQEYWYTLGQRNLDSSAMVLIKDLIERIKGLRSGAKLAKCPISELLDQLNHTLDTVQQTDKETFLANWKRLNHALKKELNLLKTACS